MYNYINIPDIIIMIKFEDSMIKIYNDEGIVISSYENKETNINQNKFKNHCRNIGIINTLNKQMIIRYIGNNIYLIKFL